MIKHNDIYHFKKNLLKKLHFVFKQNLSQTGGTKLELDITGIHEKKLVIR